VHVLIATDGSQQSLDAAQYLTTLADRSAIDEIAVLAVVSPLAAIPFTHEGAGQAPGVEEVSYRRAAQRATEKMADQLREWAPTVTTHVYGGSPSTEIVRAAAEMGTELIVVASSSSRAEAALLGSVAHRVMSSAPCPVLVVRPRPKPKRRRKA